MLHGFWDVGSPTRDQTWGPKSESTQSQPLDRQGSPESPLFLIAFLGLPQSISNKISALRENYGALSVLTAYLLLAKPLCHST